MKKQGSAIITVIAAIVVLTVLALSFIGSRRERAGISKHLSDEKKVEAMAESVSDLLLSYLKKNANKHDNPTDLYYLLRAPLKYKSKTADTDGGDIPLDVEGSGNIDNLYDYVGSVIEPLKTELGWNDSNCTITSMCEICNAEAFGPATKNYEVAGINTEHLKAFSNMASFLDCDIDSVTFVSDNDPSRWKPSDWKLSIGFPGNNETYLEKSFKVRVKLSTAEADMLKELNDESNKLTAAKEEVADAKDALKKAQDDGESEEKIAQLQAKVTEAEEALKKAQEEYDAFMADYNEGKAQVNSGGFKVKVKISARRDDKDSMVLKDMKAELSGFLKIAAKLLGLPSSWKLDDIDVQKTMEESRFFPDIRPINMEGLKNKVIEGDPEYNFSEYVGDINTRIGEVKLGYSGYTLDSSLSDLPMTIEKGAILRITTNVEYKQSETRTIKRELVSEIPFKVSDVQPIAPEYSFFVANSPLLSKQSDIISGNTLGKPIDLNNAKDTVTSSDATLAAGRFIVHNLPFSGDKPSYSEIGNTTGRVPGMVRINCNYSGKGGEVTELRSFIGCFEEPELTELNQMLSPNYKSIDNKFNTRPSFYWRDDDPKRKHEVEFPVLFEERDVAHKIEIPGVKGFVDVYRRGGFNVVMIPTLLYGNGHMEYPLGINVEGPINSIYSRIRVSAKPNALVAPRAENKVTDTTEIYYDYEPVSTYSNGNSYSFNNTANDATKFDAAPYGMVYNPCYKENESWSSNKLYKYMPANCYDAMQYAKKATKFYETGDEFWEDCKKEIADGGLKDGDNIRLAGVYYIKGDLDLPEKTFIGNGLIVVRNNINLNGNINYADENTTLGLIARVGSINFNDSCTEVHAACFSNNAPMVTGGVKIYGNLVCNDFIRKDLLEVEVFYDNRATSVTPLASLRKAGKFEPKRYYVAFADNWSKFVYEKNKEE